MHIYFQRYRKICCMFHLFFKNPFHLFQFVLCGLNEQELTYVLGPSAVYGPDYPSESFRVLKEKEIAEFGEYRTMRMVLEAFRKDER